MDLLDRDFGARIVFVEAPVEVLFLNGAVVLIDTILHQVKDQACVEVWPSAGVKYLHRDAEISFHQGIEYGALLFKHVGVVQGFLALDEKPPRPSSAVGLRRWFPEYGKADY